MRADEYRRVTEVTYLGYVHGTLAALRRMLPRDCGTIVQVGSALAFRSIPLQSAYCAAKHAITGPTAASTRARAGSAQVWLSLHQRGVALGATFALAALAGVAGGVWSQRRRLLAC